MFANIFAFELRFHLKSRLFMFSAAVFFLLSFLGVASPNVQIGALGGANYNSPFAIMQSHTIMAMIGVLVGTAFLNSAALRDNDHRMAEIIYSTRLSKVAYVLGRFGGAFVVTYLVYLGTTAGFALASFAPWLDQELIGPFVFSHYFYSAVVIGLPALFANCAIVYAVAVISRDQRIAYGVIVALLVLYQVAAGMLGQIDQRTLAALVDPSGGGALTDIMQYWTVFERNTQVVPLEGTLLYNRLIWLTVGIVMLLLTLWRFKFVIGKRSRKKKKADVAVAPRIAAPADFPRQRATFSSNTGWHQFMARVRFEVRGVVRSVFFWVLIALAAALSLGNSASLGAIFGTPVYPVTRVMINILNGSVTLSAMIVVVFYGADLVWRDREARFQEMLGSSPAPNWAFVLSKMVAAILVVVVFLLTTVVVAILFQAFNGYTNFEFDQYLIRYFYDYGTLFYLVVVLSVAVQIILPNKYFGMLFMVLYLIGLISLGAAGWEDPLYYFGRTSATPYSDMNGYGGLLGFASWYTLYWTFFAVLLGVVAYLLWDRGPLEKLRIRIGNMRANATRATGIIAAVAATGFVATFAWLFYNTHVLNEYVTSDDIRAAQAEYESRFIKWKDHPIPRVTDVSIEVDLYPSENSFEVRGKYVLENKTDAAISTVPLGFAIDVDITELAIPGGEISETDERYNFHVFEFSPAIEPGEERTLTYTGRRTRTGYKHRRNVQGLLSGGGVFGNGTFVNSGALGPYIGFNTGAILSDRNDRWREDLEPLPRFADLDDESAWGNSYLTQDADWISFKATVTTSADQIAIAPGYLIEETEEGNRRRYVYEMDAPMQNFYAVLSARYASRVEEWNDTQLAVFYEPEHEWNVDRIITSLKDSISYFNENFSQYQYRQMRVLEFPAYANFAQSFPNTVPWSEGLGFIADITDPEDIDYVYYVGAHEVAHQWWGHQVSSANVQGQTTLVETLAQYSALMVMEHEYGPHMMRRFLKYELDNYLSNRGGEAIEEMPLYRVENQGYIHYRKGAIVMYALKDYIGEEAINHALKTLIEEVAYRFDPYPTSRDLLRNLRAVATTDAQQDLITDMFERITIWDMKVAEATAAERDDGRFDVTINVTAAKFEADGEGQQVEVPLDMPIDIGIFTENPDKVFEGEEHVLLFEKHPIRSGEAEFTFVVDEMPTHVGIDPYNKLIDRNSDDNIDTVN